MTKDIRKRRGGRSNGRTAVEERGIPIKGLIAIALLTCAASGLVLLTRTAFGSVLYTSAASQDPPRYDGICKSSAMPVGYVPVAEFQSPECEPTDPFTMNAWELRPVDDGVVSCVKPNYVTAPAALLDYVMCNSVHSDKCPAKADGTSNAFVLRRPASCLKSTEKNPVLSVVRLLPAGSNLDMYPIEKLDVHDALGNPVPTFVWEGVPYDQPTPVCKVRERAQDTIIIRKYHSTNCPSSSQDDLNGWVIMRHPYQCREVRETCDSDSDSDQHSGTRRYKPECGGPEGKPNSHLIVCNNGCNCIVFPVL